MVHARVTKVPKQTNTVFRRSGQHTVGVCGGYLWVRLLAHLFKISNWHKPAFLNLQITTLLSSHSLI